MKAVYDEFFYVPKDGKVREKVMLVRITVSVVLMIICLAAMSISAYAYFACNVSSTYNVIQSTNFEAVVSVVSIVDQSTETPVTVVTTDKRVHTAVLKSGETYRVTMRPTGTATTGFCVVSAAGCAEVYHTQQLGMDGDRFVPEVSFSLMVSADTTVSIFAHWGTSSYYDAYTNKGVNDQLYITHGEQLALTITPPTESVALPEDEDDTTTSQQTTTTTTVADSDETTTTTTVTTGTTLDEAEETTTQPSTTTSATEATEPTVTETE